MDSRTDAPTRAFSGRQLLLPLLVGLAALLATAGVLALREEPRPAHADRTTLQGHEEHLASSAEDHSSHTTGGDYAFGGASVRGALPDGWVRSAPGRWVDRRDRLSIGIVTGDTAARDLRGAVRANLAGLALTHPDATFDAPRSARLFGEPALLVRGVDPTPEGRISVAQRYVLGGDELLIATAHAPVTASAAQRREVERVVDALRRVR